MAHAKAPANPNDFILPDLGEGVHEAELIAWRVQVGQEVAEHDILAEMETDKALATPAVRRLARDMGVDIAAIAGTGIGGRVTEKDIRSAGSGGHSDVAPSEPEEPHSGAPIARVAAPPARRPAPAPTRTPGIAPRAPSAPTPRPQAPAIPAGADTVRIPFRGVRRTIAGRL